MTVFFSGRARLDLRNILLHIAEDDPAAALAQVERVEQVISLLEEQPLLGHDGRVPGTRELSVDKTPYVVVYQVTGGDVDVLRVYHGRQLRLPPR